MLWFQEKTNQTSLKVCEMHSIIKLLHKNHRVSEFANKKYRLDVFDSTIEDNQNIEHRILRSIGFCRVKRKSFVVYIIRERIDIVF